jgi:hypothetical protein
MKRRQFLMMVGGGVLVAATGTAAGFVGTRTPTTALRPWQDAGSLYDEPRRRALSYAILAPNPHNRQPWLVELVGEDTVVLYVDTNRVLPQTDPFNRQITIGLGCFLELLTMAAAADQYRVETELFPEGEDASHLDKRPVARLRFVADTTVTADPLFAHALERRSLKEPYDQAKPVPQDILDALKGIGRHGHAIDASGQPEHVAALRTLTHRALDIEIATPRTYKESVDLFRIGKAEIEANPDGIDFGSALFDTLALFGQFNRETALDPGSLVYAQGVEAVMANVDSAMAHIWLVSSGNSRADQIAVGRDWLRINLAATAAGVGFHPLSQALQEFPEMAECYAEAHQRLAPEGGTVQMLARLGYAAPAAPSPRWPLASKIIAEG